MSGNQLVPATETDIAVTKEILTIKRVDNENLKVTVYYEFLNPKSAKSLIVGFEAASPDRGKEGVAPFRDFHPYMKDFTVKMNNARLPYKITLVHDSLYLKGGKINSLTTAEAIATESEYVDSDADTRFNYVYYFDANFKKGANIIEHTYTVKLTGGIHYYYAYYYILTAAMRWGNKQIDDFTLILDMGDYQDFCLYNTVFQGANYNLIGSGKTLENAPNTFGFPDDESQNDRLRFFIKKGRVEFKIKNFRPTQELFLYSPRFYPDFNVFDYTKKLNLPFSCLANGYYGNFIETTDDTSKRILRNLPFARRGYIFNTPAIQKFYSQQVWYIPDSNYKSSMESLTIAEQEWVNHYSN
ncbi:MAG: YARHG domain-containing protein [Dysgonomonas sp.]|nr:YARHG domain-containing protein [Dysgonomonas sp.]